MDFYWNVLQSWIYEHFANPSSLMATFQGSSAAAAATSSLLIDTSSNSTTTTPISANQRSNTTRHFNTMDGNCPVCLNPFLMPVETNCGHLFCGQCIVVYWQQSQWRGGPIKCPVCRQQVNILLKCFNINNISSTTNTPTNNNNSSSLSSSSNPNESSNNGTTATESNGTNLLETARQLISDINRYNRKFSGEPRPWYDYLYDLPTMLRHLSNDFFSFNGLFYMFRIRVIICFIAAIMYLISPLDMIPEAVFGIFGLFDDIVIVLLLAIYVTIMYRRFLSSRWDDN